MWASFSNHVPRVISVATLLALTACNSATEDASDSMPDPGCRSEIFGQVLDVHGGSMLLGTEAVYDEEGPPRTVLLGDFRIDAHEVTNDQFAAFVEATGYLTEAERPPPNADQLPQGMRGPGSVIFDPEAAPGEQWWFWTPGANWRYPEGPGSDIDGRGKHPVVHVSVRDAHAYARWAGGSLPTEDQWEFAARGGAEGAEMAAADPDKPIANHYQGVFPIRDLGDDGFVGTSPAGCFPPNAIGAHDMIGNVWEWTSNTEPEEGSPRGLIKGGSFLCAKNYCRRYRPSARQYQELDLGTSHVGFRLVYEAKEAPTP